MPHFLAAVRTEEYDDSEEAEQEEVKYGIGCFFFIKRNNTFMFLSPDQLRFLEMTNYIAPGFSNDKYLKASGCEVTKGYFPYEYMECLVKLDDRRGGMTTLRDLLVWCNNRDVIPFLQAIHRHFAF